MLIADDVLSLCGSLVVSCLSAQAKRRHCTPRIARIFYLDILVQAAPRWGLGLLFILVPGEPVGKVPDPM